MPLPKEYIGDGAYARVDEGPALVLTAENGISIIDEVAIDYQDIPKLLMFIKVHFPSAFKGLVL